MKNTIGVTADLEAYKEMKMRVITAAFGIPALLLVLLAAPKELVGLIWGLLMAIGAYELLFCTGLVKEKRLVIYSSVMAFVVTLWSTYDAIHAYAVLGVMVFMGLMFAEMMMSHIKITFEKVCLVLVGGLLVPYLLSSLIRILVMSIGRYVVLIPFIVAFSSDSGAYFAGRFFGKHKMAPVISQHKTIEGAIGGVISAMVCMLIYAIIMQIFFDFKVYYGYALIYGFLGSIVGIFGDLCFSIVKRQTGIKDYGNLIPGHGGILDRFDSMMMVGPLMEVLLLLIPIVVA